MLHPRGQGDGNGEMVQPSSQLHPVRPLALSLEVHEKVDSSPGGRHGHCWYLLHGYQVPDTLLGTFWFRHLIL